jgi:hypothetical protein
VRVKAGASRDEREKEGRRKREEELWEECEREALALSEIERGERSGRAVSASWLLLAGGC